MKIPQHVDEQEFVRRLDQFQIETPSWGYADTGTRFGKFLQGWYPQWRAINDGARQ